MEPAVVGTQDQVQPVAIAESPSHVELTPQQEKMIPQSEVNKIVGRVRDETRQDYYERGKAEALSELQKSQQQSQQNLGGIAEITPEKVDKLIEDKITERANAEYGRRIAQDFISKLETGKERYPDFEETVTQLNLPQLPQLVTWANSLDNTADVVYEIGKNPSKFANILMLANTSPELARREMMKLSDSIKKNQEAKSQPKVDAPLSQLRPSNTGTDNGKMGVRDLRKQPWLKA